MPYHRLPEAVALMLALTVLAFWPDYYSRFATAPAAFHIHGITATIWLLLLAGQGWTARRRQFALHRALGRVSLGYFPLFLAGMAAVLHSMSAAMPTSPFYAVHGAHLGYIDLIAAGMVAWLFAQALAVRHSPQLHARYMVATSLFLLSPIFGRLAGHLIPPLAIAGPAEFWKFTWAAQIGNVVALVAALALYRAAPRHGRPFRISAIAIAGQAVFFPVIDRSAAWRSLYGAVGMLPLAAVMATGAAVGALAAWHGWTLGDRSGGARRAISA